VNGPPTIPLVCDPLIRDAARALGDGPLAHDALRAHIDPLFSRVLARRAHEIYLANHSLGRPLDAVRDEVLAALDAWPEDLDEAWGLWIDRRERYRAEIARLLGMQRTDAVVPKTSAAQGLRAVVHALETPRPKIVSTHAEFDSIDFVLKAMRRKGHARVRLVETDEHGILDEQRLIDAIDASTDLVVCSIVCFALGQRLTRIGEILDAAHAHGARVVLDTYHAAGVFPIPDDARRADFMIGGNYKYTRGGPGACWLAIRPDLLNQKPSVPDPDALFTTDTGWFAKHDTFSYARGEDPLYAAGGDAWLEATPPVLTHAQALPGLVLTNAIGVDRLRAHSLQQLRTLTELLESRGLRVATPEHHGAYTLVPVDDANASVGALRSNGVNADARPSPGGAGAFVRLCPDILTTGEEIERAAAIVAQVLG